MSKSGGTSVNRQNWQRTKEEFSTSTQEGYRINEHNLVTPAKRTPTDPSAHPLQRGPTQPSSRFLGPRQHLNSEVWQRAGLLTRTHFCDPMTGLPRNPAAPQCGVLLSIPLPYEPRSTPTRSSTEHPATISAARPPTPSVGRLLDVDSPLSRRISGCQILVLETRTP